MGRTRTETEARSPGVLRRLSDSLRQLLLVLLCLGAVGAVGWVYILRHLDDSIREAVESRLQQRLAGTPCVVKVRAARRIEGQGIEIRGIELRDRVGGSLIATIDEMCLECSTDLQDLINGQIDIRQVVLRRAELHVVRQDDGQFNLATLIKHHPAGETPIPRVRFEDGAITIYADSRAAQRQLELRHLCGELQPATKEIVRRLVGNEVSSESRAPAELDSAAESSSPLPWHVRVRCGGEHCEGLELDGLLDPTDHRWLATGTLRGLKFSRELVDSLPSECSGWLAPLASLQARSEIRFRAARWQTAEGPCTFHVTGDVAQGRWEDPRLPTPLTDLTAKFDFTHQGGRIQRLAGRCGDALFELALDCRGYSITSPVKLTLRTRGFDLNRSWVELMSSDVRSAWEKLAPLGKFDADVVLDYDGTRWNPDLTIRCQDVSLAYAKFPYRLVGGQGFIEYHDGLLTTRDFTVQAHGRPVVIDVKLREPASGFLGHVALRLEQPVPIDDELLAALAPDAQRILRSLQPRGEITLQGRFARETPDAPLDRWLEIVVPNGSIQYVGFPYAVDRIRGKLEWRGERWQISEMTGHNDSAYVVARGGWTSTPDGLTDFRLEFEATDVPFDEELKAAIPASGQRLWNHLQPRGTLDYLTVAIQYPLGPRRWSVEVFGQKRPAAQNTDGRYLTVRPAWSPFPLDNVVGSFRYLDGRVELDGLRAEHGRTVFNATGVCEIASDGNWTAHLPRVYVDRLNLDRELLEGMPSGMGASLARLNWQGPLNAEGMVRLTGSPRPQDPIRTQWDVRFDLENGSLNCGVPIEQIRGEVRLAGQGDSQQMATHGELQIDSAICRGIQVTQLRGPFWISPSRVVFGDAWAQQRRADRPPRQVSAQLFGGQVATDAILELGEELGFQVQADVQNLDLQLIAQEALPKKRDVFGRAFASLQLAGTAHRPNTWRGGGKVTCRDADINELPVVVALLKPLSARRDEGNKLSLSDLDFRLAGDRIYFDRIDFKGDAMMLRGSGEMTLNRIVDLQFYTLMGRDELRVPFLAPVLAEASRQIMEIRVTGPAEDPVVDRKVVPVINEALQKMFPELNARAAERPPLLNRVPGPGLLIPRGPASRR